MNLIYHVCLSKIFTPVTFFQLNCHRKLKQYVAIIELLEFVCITLATIIG